MVGWTHATHFVRVTATGAASAEEQFEAIRAAAHGPAFTAGHRILYDARHLTDEAASPGTLELRDYAAQIAALGYRRFALVVGPDRVEITSAFALFCAENGIDARVFSDLERATRWLESDIPARPAA
jgi:hypothetical protein